MLDCLLGVNVPDKVFQIKFIAVLYLYCKTKLCCPLQVIYETLNKIRPVIKQDVFRKVVIGSASHVGQM